MIFSNILHLSGLFDVQPCLGTELSCGSQGQPHQPRASVDLNRLKFTRIEGQPKAEGSDVNASASRIERHDLNHGAVLLDIPAKCQPSELLMMNEIRTCVPGVPKEVRAIVT